MADHRRSASAPSPHKKPRWLLGIWVLLGLILIIGGPLFAVFSDDSRPEPRAPTLDVASNAGARFLEQYVDPDGRVVRRDQGNDTVSEGQAYAMLVAAAIGDRPRFDSSWQWSKSNLKQPSGLFAWQWRDGKVVDPQPATDADLDMSRALVVASRQFGDEKYATEARALASDIADETLAYAYDGKPVILAGPWAKQLPFYLNPSYHSPRAEAELAKLTGDDRWPAAMERQRDVIASLSGTFEEPKLPSDWALMSSDGMVTAASPPNRNEPPKYSYDAVRTPIRLAESCDPVDRRQAAQMWSVLNESKNSRSSLPLSLDGDTQNDEQQSVAAVGSAAAAKAAGDTQQMTDLLDLADRTDTNRPTYYGSAWAALGRIMLTTTWLGAC